MSGRLVQAGLALLFLWSALVLALSPEGRLQGPVAVLRVVDGDTVDLEGLGRVRLIGIDTPESSANDRARLQARQSGREVEEVVRLGQEAKRFTESLLRGKRVWLELDVQERDRYGRVLAYLYLEDPRGDWSYGGKRYRQVNLEVVRAGWADPLTIPPNVRYAGLYLEASREARAKGLGMWGGGASSPQGTTPGTENRKGCDPAYPTVCIPPPPPDLNCGDIPYRGFKVLPPDPHRFDRDRDGVGCEG
ncbi:thermonuclease family protein [Allomeiothermus silvanus]|uniref:thermonuclease family protein n=1 Tax=Allomeiothermus silvanus TaxID=52022 RepID=UPI0023F1C532|nr:thermonuclease family protein [Allomeiothermus silvanus]